MITTNQAGFYAELYTDNHAKMYARGSENIFEVSLCQSFEDSWFFGEADCREAAEFFIKLADELKRCENDDE